MMGKADFTRRFIRNIIALSSTPVTSKYLAQRTGVARNHVLRIVKRIDGVSAKLVKNVMTYTMGE